MTTPTGPEPVPQLLADLDRCLAQADPEAAGAAWRLEQPDRQLDANLVRLPAHHRIEMHREPDVDVLLLPLTGSGTLDSEDGPLPLTAHALMWLPVGSRRALTAGPDGLAYLTVHRRRTGLRIRLPRDPEALRRLEAREEAEEGGESACLLPRLCPHCGAPLEGSAGGTCAQCGESLGDR